MILADFEGARVVAAPHLRGSCPSCKRGVIAKCGEIKIWHWAHEVNDCDPWAEPETEWHANWKEEFPERCREVTIGPHRADVRLDSGSVIEFQHSPISAEDIGRRESHYQNMAWVIDARSIEEHFSFRHKGSHLTFRWKWPRRSWAEATAPIFLDFGGSLFRIHKAHWHDGASAYGWGRDVSYARFLGRARMRLAEQKAA